jgi:hypothetical protein
LTRWWLTVPSLLASLSLAAAEDLKPALLERGLLPMGGARKGPGAKKKRGRKKKRKKKRGRESFLLKKKRVGSLFS